MNCKKESEKLSAIIDVTDKCIKEESKIDYPDMLNAAIGNIFKVSITNKDEFEDLINKISNNYAVSHDDMADSFKLLSERLIKGNKKKNENSFLNYEKEIVGYELLYDAK